MLAFILLNSAGNLLVMVLDEHLPQVPNDVMALSFVHFHGKVSGVSL